MSSEAKPLPFTFFSHFCAWAADLQTGCFETFGELSSKFSTNQKCSLRKGRERSAPSAHLKLSPISKSSPNLEKNTDGHKKCQGFYDLIVMTSLVLIKVGPGVVCLF